MSAPLLHQAALLDAPAAPRRAPRSLRAAPAISRFRLELVREAREPFDAAGLDAMPLGNPEAVARRAMQRFATEPFEVMVAAYLDVRNRLIGYHVAYRGTLGRAAVEPRGILAPALLCNAGGFVLIHNHPSGDPSPSAEDLAFTRRMSDAGETLGIHLLDHLVIGDAGRWVSLRRRGGW